MKYITSAEHTLIDVNAVIRLVSMIHENEWAQYSE